MVTGPKIASIRFRVKNPKVFHSIRWRLVASYVLLSLLTVSIVGVLATEIVRRYIQEQVSLFRESVTLIVQQKCHLQMQAS